MFRSLQRVLLALTLSVSGLVNAQNGAMDQGLQAQTKTMVESGLRFLESAQADDGSWSQSVGVTALALRALLESHAGYNEASGDVITKPIDFLLAHVNPDGSISETNTNRNYNTAVAMVALQATGNPEYAPLIENAQRFLKGLQVDESEGYERSHKYYGGIGYGSDERPDMSNLYLALEALNATELAADDPTWEKALVFVSRSQNNSETNDQSFAGNDGGFIYMPDYSPNGDTTSYGGMTHAGLLSLLFAGTDKDDPRVKAAYDWIKANYTVESNPGSKKNQGYFYYLNAFAKSMYAWGDPLLVDTAGTSHNWRDDLARRLQSLQRADGAWINEASPRYWEGDPNLCTAWTVIALNHVLTD